MKMRSFPAFAVIMALFALGMEAKAEEAVVAKSESKVTNPALKKHLMDNIDVFGKSEMPAIYILGPGDEEIEGALLVRDFSRDPFFMQNIDREEFELKVTLRDLSEFDTDKEKEKEQK
jgi:hypothetical protein